MKIQIQEMTHTYVNRFVVEISGYYGDGDFSDSTVLDFPVDSLEDSIIIGEIVETFQKLEKNYACDYGSNIPRWEEWDLNNVLPYSVLYEQIMRVEDYKIFYYDHNGIKKLVKVC